MDTSGTVVFNTVGRANYGFDVFSLPLSNPTSAAELRLTDTLSINFNAHFTDDGAVVFISERTGSPRIYLTRPGLPSPQPLPSVPDSLFHDRPVLKASALYFISAHQRPDQPFTSWSALYGAKDDVITRLTPLGSVDFSPAVSLSGRFVAVASYGSRPWAGEFHHLETDVVVFEASDPDNRVVVCRRGGWPSWCGDSAVYFHRQADDGWWSIYRVGFAGIKTQTDPISPVRVTPPGVHCFTPAALQDGKGVVVATRRRDRKFRHIELFDLATDTFRPLTVNTSPEFHHYNPFVSADSKLVGYHRFRGQSGGVKSVIPNLDPVTSAVKSLRMLRMNGSFPSFSPGGDLIAFNHAFLGDNAGLKIMKSDGSKRWTLIKGRTVFYNSWSPVVENGTTHAIYASIGPIFESAKATVQIARITFDASDLKCDRDDVPCEVKILTKDETGNNAFPCVSPDGKCIVFRSGRSGHKNLYILDAAKGEFDGGSVRQLTDGAWIDTMPSWSPDGELVAFSSNRHKAEDDSVFSIYVVRADGSGLRRIHVVGAEGSSDVDRERINHVCFSSDGEWLLFAANLGGVTAEPVSLPNQFQPYGDLYVVRVDGSGLRRLTWGAYENGTPAWHSEELGGLSLGSDDDGDELLGQFEEPLWITFDF